MSLLISCDTETTGLDFFHGAKPFLVTTCDTDYENKWWEWDVNPETRQPIIPDKSMRNLKKYLSGKRLVFHNSKFDTKALSTVGVEFDWDDIVDTVIAYHMVSSSTPKDLTSLTLEHLDIDVQPYEDKIKTITKEARALAKREFPSWRLAKDGLSDMPSIKASSSDEEDKPWKNDMWLPRAIAKERKYKKGHPWYTACSEYANSDTATTLPLWLKVKKWLIDNGLMAIFKERMKVLPILYQMEMNGITFSQERLEELREQYKDEYNKRSQRCKNIATAYGYELELPKAALNNSLREFCFGEEYLNLPVVVKTKKGGASLDKSAKSHYLMTLDGPKKKFIQSLNIRSKLATSIGYMESYEKFALPSEFEGFNVLHSSLNATGTATLRMSSKNPNQQQISKLEDHLDGRSLRYLFGPPSGKEWWSLDYDNLELRIPAYECREPAMLELFEHPDKAPFFGSYHMLIVSILHEKEWKKCLNKAGEEDAAELFKKLHKSTLYQWTKNGNFAELYGAVDREDGEGTADKAFHLKGAQKKIASRLKEKKSLNDHYVRMARETGFVYTMPDSEVCPEKGYPLRCSRGNRHKVKPTIPLNYHVQGTACWIMMRAMIRVQEYFNKLGPEHRLVMNVHDELVLEMPYKSDKRNLTKVQKVARIMESIGECVGVKLTCGIDYNRYNWSQSV